MNESASDDAGQAPNSGNLLSLNPETRETPRTRLASASHARDMFLQDVRNYTKRSARNAQVAGLVDGNPPLVQSELTKQGQAWRSNFNSGEGKGFFDVAQTAFYDVVSASETLCRITVNDDKPEAAELGNIITGHFQKLLNEFEDALDSIFQTTQHDLVLYSMGPVVWEDEFNWLPKRVKYRLVRLPEECPSDVDEWPRVSIEYNYGVGELYRFIANPEIATQAGWNVAAVKDAIITTATSSDPAFAGENRWEVWQERLSQNDIYWNSRVDKVRVARMLFKEFADSDGNEQITDAWVAVNTADDRFLFKKERRFDAMSDVVCPFFYERGDGTANGIKGLGVRMFPMLTQSMRLLNASVDSTYSSMTTFLQPVGAGSNTNLPIINRGPYTIFPAGVNFIQRNIQGIMDAPMQMRGAINDTMMKNLANYRQRINEKDGNPRTKFELETLVTQNSVLSATQLARYFKQLDAFGGTMFKRAALAPISGIEQKWAIKAREFRTKCKEDGVPEATFKKCTVRWVRPVGAGNPQQRFQALMTIKQMLGPTMSAQGMEALDRDIVNALGTPDAVRRYLPKPENRIADQQNLYEAQGENNDFSFGGQMPVVDGQDDVIHLEVHLGFANQAAGSIQQGGEPMKVYTTLEAVGQHSALHLERLRKNPAKVQQFKELESRFKALAQATDQLRNHLEQQMQQEQEGQAAQQQAQSIMDGTDPETQILAAKAQRDMEIKTAKAQQQMALKAQTAQQNMALKDATTAQNITIKKAQTMTPQPSMMA